MRTLTSVFVACLVAVGVTAASTNAAGPVPKTVPGRYMMIAPNKAAFNAAVAAAKASRAGVALTMPQVNTLAINASPSEAAALARRSGAKLVPDRIVSLAGPQFRDEAGWNDPTKVDPATTLNRLAAMGRTPSPFSTPAASPFDVLAGFTPDPAFDLTGLMWNVNRVGGPGAWSLNGGDDDVLVAVADTGLDYTHEELADKVVAVQDFTTNEAIGVGGPSICEYFYGFDDDDLATTLGASRNNDFNGHGSWIGGNIAAEVNANSINGIAPGISLVALKISQWCGFAFDSEILAAFVWAADQGVDVVSLSFGGYLDREDPAQDAIWDLYVASVKYAKANGTTIVSSAGNDHTRVTGSGKVVSHGILSLPPGGDDYYGLYETPGGVPGVVFVSATGNVVSAASASCDVGSTGSATDARAWCKPTTDAHQPFGVGQLNQLAYYSNYGPRVDVAAPGGARKFNLPSVDRGGTEGWPFTGMDSYVSDNDPGGGVSEADGFNAWEDFSITSNFAQEIPCVMFDGTSADPDPDGYYGVPTQTGFDDDQCYSTIQGTSMAAPHVSAVVALIASAYPALRGNVAGLVTRLKKTTTSATNFTPPVSKTDLSNTDRTNEACPSGYCHLGGKAIKNKEAYGAGIVNAANAVAGGVGATAG